MINFIAQGRCIRVTLKASELAENIRSGQPIRVGSLFGIAAGSVLKHDAVGYPLVDQPNERAFSLYLEGIYELPCDASAFAIGDKVYFDPIAKVVTATPPDQAKGADSTFLIGTATESIKRADGALRVRLNGISV